jgi:hypothetical protein
MSLRLLFIGCLLAGPLAAQTVVPPKDPSLVLSRLTDRTHDYHYLRRAPTDTAEREFYRYHLEERLVTIDGVAGLLIVKHSLSPSFPFVDSLFVEREGLSPRWEHMHIQKAAITLTYDGARIRRTRTVSDSGTTRSDTTYVTPVFAFNEQELVLRSLPLRTGFSAIVPLYSEGSDSLEMDTVTVVGALSPASGSEGAWTVRFADPAIVETYVIDEKTRQIVSHETVGRRAKGKLRVVG